jgi:hypothetical protein
VTLSVGITLNALSTLETSNVPLLGKAFPARRVSAFSVRIHRHHAGRRHCVRPCERRRRQRPAGGRRVLVLQLSGDRRAGQRFCSDIGGCSLRIGEVNGLARVAVQFLNDAQSYAGTCRNRMNSKGRWEDEPSPEDWWGRCIWGLGTAAAHSGVGLVRRFAVIQVERAAKARSPWPRAMGFAALGAAELLSIDPGQRAAHELLTDYADTVAKPNGDSAWPWPEPRLTYANAVFPEAMLGAGVALDDSTLRQQGLDLLGWLVEYETVEG